MDSPGQNTEVSSLSLLQGIFPTQGSNPGLQHCEQILYHLSHKRIDKADDDYHHFTDEDTEARTVTAPLIAHS